MASASLHVVICIEHCLSLLVNKSVKNVYIFEMKFMLFLRELLIQKMLKTFYFCIPAKKNSTLVRYVLTLRCWFELG